MKSKDEFEIIIIGGSFAGLSAALTLGRSLRKVLVIDSGQPCNSQTPHSHNFLTQDGKTPKEISSIALKQIKHYKTIVFHNDIAIRGTKTEDGFEITTQQQKTFKTQRVIFATGIKDILPNIEGVVDCWGISIIHCPYCHGYEVKNEKTGILGNGEYGFEFARMIHHWTKDLTLFTNGKSTLTSEQTQKLNHHNIKIVEKEIGKIEHENGQIEHIIFNDGSKSKIKALYAKANFIQHSSIPENLGCELTEEGYIKVDMAQKTTIPGLFACGDNTTFKRSISNAVAAGALSATIINKELIEENF